VQGASKLAFVALVACHPSASIENTMPVANLQTYHSVGLRVQSTAFASQGRAAMLENAMIGYLRQKCGFESVGRAEQGRNDVILDLTVTAAGRGGGGLISNPNLATLDAMLVLSDGQNGELLGSAKVHGQSSSVVINNSNPENEAIDVMAKTIAEMLGKSGCSGPRIAKVTPPPPPPVDTGSAGPGPGSGSAPPPPPVDESHRQEAEALNDSGKTKFRKADTTGALADFQGAKALISDARYIYNICLVYEAQEQWQQAITTCREARSANPPAEFVERIDYRIELLTKHTR
jgi:hypothetical protein